METTNIYVLIDPETNKVRYVGKANRISERYKAHLNRARKHQTHKKNWIDSLRKKGLRPIIEIIDIVSIKEWQYWEVFWISQMKTWGFNLVNHTHGGDGCSFSNQTSFKKGNGAKPIVALSREGKFIAEFPNIREGEKFCNRKCVDHALSKRLKSAGGYLWLHKDKYGEMSEIELKEFIEWCNSKKVTYHPGCFKKGKKLDNLRKPWEVVQYDLGGNVIKIHKNLSDAAKVMSCHPENIRAACVGISSTAKGYKWKYKK